MYINLIVSFLKLRQSWIYLLCKNVCKNVKKYFFRESALMVLKIEIISVYNWLHDLPFVALNIRRMLEFLEPLSLKIIWELLIVEMKIVNKKLYKVLRSCCKTETSILETMVNPVTRKVFLIFLHTFEFLQLSRIKHPKFFILSIVCTIIFKKKKKNVKVEASCFRIRTSGSLYILFFLPSYISLNFSSSLVQLCSWLKERK